MALHSALHTLKSLSCDPPEESFTFITVGRGCGRPHLQHNSQIIARVKQTYNRITQYKQLTCCMFSQSTQDLQHRNPPPMPGACGAQPHHQTITPRYFNNTQIVKCRKHVQLLQCFPNEMQETCPATAVLPKKYQQGVSTQKFSNLAGKQNYSCEYIFVKKTEGRPTRVSSEGHHCCITHTGQCTWQVYSYLRHHMIIDAWQDWHRNISTLNPCDWNL